VILYVFGRNPLKHYKKIDGFEIQMFYELCKSPAMFFQSFLRKLFFNAFLAKLLESKSEEERAMYGRGYVTALASRSCQADTSNPDSVYHYEILEQVCREVEKNLNEIGPDFLPRFFKLCELSGFPSDLCDLSKGYESSLRSLISHLTDLSIEIRRTAVESPEILGLLRVYESMQVVFNMHEVGKFLSDLPQEVQDALELLRLYSILNVDSFEFRLLKVRASMCFAQTEEDLQKLMHVFEEIDKISSNIDDHGISWDSVNAQKLAYLHYIVPLFATFLTKHLMNDTQLPCYLMSSISQIGTKMECFVQEILSARDGVYEKIYKSLPDSRIIPPEKRLLKQFLKEKVTDQIDILRRRVPTFLWI